MVQTKMDCTTCVQDIIIQISNTLLIVAVSNYTFGNAISNVIDDYSETGSVSSACSGILKY